MTAGESLSGATAQTVEAKDLLRTQFDATLILNCPDGTIRTASARKMLEEAGDDAKTWLNGPVATEWLLSGLLLDEAGELRRIKDYYAAQ